MFLPHTSQKQLRNPWSILCRCRAGWLEPPDFPGSPCALAGSSGQVRAALAACPWPAWGGWQSSAWGVATARHAEHTCRASPARLGQADARGGLGCASWVPQQRAQCPLLRLGATGAGGRAQAVSVSSRWLKSRLPACPKLALGLRASSILPGSAGCLHTACLCPSLSLNILMTRGTWPRPC